MQINIYSYQRLKISLLLLIHTIAVYFYFLFDIEALQKDIVFLISLFVLILNIKYIKKFLNLEDKYIYLFPLYGIISTCIMASFNFGQPLVHSLLASRILLIIAILYISLKFILNNISLNLLYKLAFSIALFLTLFQFYLYYSGNLSILYVDTTFAFRMGSIRLTIAPETLVVLLLFFYYHSKEKLLSYIPFFGLLLTLIIIDKTRATLIAVILILLFSLINLKEKKTLYSLFFFIIIVIFSMIFTNFESSIFQPLIDMYTNTQKEVVSGAGNVNVRALEFAYFLKFLDLPSIIFGYGMDNNTFKVLYYEHFYLSDLGIFKVFYLHGIIGLMLFLGIYYQMYKQASKSNTPLHRTGKALVLFQIFAPTLNFTYHIEGMLMFFIIYILIKNFNIRNNLNG